MRVLYSWAASSSCGMNCGRCMCWQTLNVLKIRFIHLVSVFYNFKVIYHNEALFNMQWALFYNGAAFLLVDAFVVSFALHVFLYEFYKNTVKRV